MTTRRATHKPAIAIRKTVARKKDTPLRSVRGKISKANAIEELARAASPDLCDTIAGYSGWESVCRKAAISRASCSQMPKSGIAVPGLIVVGAISHRRMLSWVLGRTPAIKGRAAMPANDGPT